MAAHDLPQGAGEGIVIQLGFESDGRLEVVNRVVGGQMAHEPEALLGVGEGQVCLSGRARADGDEAEIMALPAQHFPEEGALPPRDR